MTVELKGRACLRSTAGAAPSLDGRQTRDIPAIEVQEIEGMVDEPHAALAIGGRLGKPLRPRLRLLDRLGKLRRNESGRGEPLWLPSRRDGLDLATRPAERLMTRDMART
jgi:hypothetical protein